MSQVKVYSRRLKLPGAVGEKAEEYHRLAEVKCSSVMRTEPCLTLVCIDLACGKLGEPADKKQIQRLSGMQPKAYLSSYQMVEKMLNVSAQVGLKDLTVRFGSFQAEGLAEELMKRYKDLVESKYTAAQKEALDLNKPLYPAAALYCACKLLKIRCDKTKHQEASLSSKSVFQKVIDEMNQCAPQNTDNFKGRKRKLPTQQESKESKIKEGECDDSLKMPRLKVSRRATFHSRIQSDPTSEIYMKWREDILKEAKSKLSAS